MKRGREWGDKEKKRGKLEHKDKGNEEGRERVCVYVWVCVCRIETGGFAKGELHQYRSFLRSGHAGWTTKSTKKASEETGRVAQCKSLGQEAARARLIILVVVMIRFIIKMYQSLAIPGTAK